MVAGVGFEPTTFGFRARSVLRSFSVAVIPSSTNRCQRVPGIPLEVALEARVSRGVGHPTRSTRTHTRSAPNLRSPRRAPKLLYVAGASSTNEGPGGVEAAFEPEKYARFTEPKRTWDPTNLFHHNQNIPPAP